ncbi:MAG: hypothetical protein K0S04_2304, partial [Herbinix sp.]|nr:hypothetical protein [Herbinix sp.]
LYLQKNLIIISIETIGNNDYRLCNTTRIVDYEIHL